MLEIQLNNVLSVVHGPADIHKKLDKALAFRSEKYERGIKYKIAKELGRLKRLGHKVDRHTYANVARTIKESGWDGFTHLYRIRGHTGLLGTGLIPYLTRLLLESEIDYVIHDARANAPPLLKRKEIKINGNKLYDYQSGCVDTLLSLSLRVSSTDNKETILFPRGIVEIPTAGGKTPAIAELLNRCIDWKKGKPQAVVLIHTKTLLHQTAKVFNSIFGKGSAGTIGDGNRFDSHPIVVATVQTLHQEIEAYREIFKAVSVLVSDECHHLSAKTFKEAANHVDAFIRVGFSATPFSTDIVEINQLRAITGDPIYIKKPKELEAAGRIVPVHMYYIRMPAPPDVTVQHGSIKRTFKTEQLKYNAIKSRIDDSTLVPGAYDVCICNYSRRNTEIVNLVQSRRAGSKILILVSSLEHGRILADLLGCAFLSGKESSETRANEIARMESSKSTYVLVASTIFNEGVDAPVIDYEVLAGCGKSARQLIQKVGRGRRLHEGKKHLVVVDFLDLGHRRLREQSRARVLTSEKEGYKIFVVNNAKEIL